MPLLRGFTGPQDRVVFHHGHVDPRLLDSLAEDLCATEQDEPSRDTIPARFADREVDECSSAGSESCWGETEDTGDDEVVEWGTLLFAQAVPAPHVVDCDRVPHRVEHQGSQGRLLKHSQLVSALHCDGSATVGARDNDGAALVRARRRKERTYPELVVRRARARLVVLAGEVAGRWSEETRVFIRLLARAHTRNETTLMGGELNKPGG